MENADETFPGACAATGITRGKPPLGAPRLCESAIVIACRQRGKWGKSEGANNSPALHGANSRSAVALRHKLAENGWTRLAGGLYNWKRNSSDRD